jgi:hypothetical protein
MPIRDGFVYAIRARTRAQIHTAQIARVISSSPVAGDAFEEAVEEGGTVGLVVVPGVVALADEDGHELGLVWK